MADNVTGKASRLAPVTPDEAVSGIRSGDRVYIGTGAAEPDALIEALTSMTIRSSLSEPPTSRTIRT